MKIRRIFIYLRILRKPNFEARRRRTSALSLSLSFPLAWLSSVHGKIAWLLYHPVQIYLLVDVAIKRHVSQFSSSEIGLSAMSIARIFEVHIAEEEVGWWDGIPLSSLRCDTLCPKTIRAPLAQ